MTKDGEGRKESDGRKAKRFLNSNQTLRSTPQYKLAVRLNVQLHCTLY